MNQRIVGEAILIGLGFKQEKDFLLILVKQIPSQVLVQSYPIYDKC